MDWKRHLEDCYAASQARTEYGVFPLFDTPASVEDLLKVEVALKVVFPTSLKDLLRQTNGVFEQMSINGKIIKSGTFIFPLAKLHQLNKNFPWNEVETKQNFNSFIFFGTAGVDGICFAFKASSQNPNLDDEVYTWYPYEGDFVKMSNSLADFVCDWIMGKLSV
jgi:hypothetical protein